MDCGESDLLPRLKRSFFIFVISITFFLPIAGMCSVQEFDLKNSSKIIKNYLKLHKLFIGKFCRGGTEEKFWDKFREYNKNAFYIPITLDGKVDKVTINSNLPEILKKKQWTNDKIKFLVKLKNFKGIKKDIEKLRKKLEELLKYKHDYFESENKKNKRIFKEGSRVSYIEFKKQFQLFLYRVPFLLSYNFPVNHFDLRKNYDYNKYKSDYEAKQRANEIFFYRKIVEDGSRNSSHKRSDLFLRAAIDTVYLNLDKKADFISEDLRYDVFYVLNKIGGVLGRGKKRQISRMKEWKDRLKRQYDFYHDLIHCKKCDGENIAKSKAKAFSNLKDFVLKKQSKVYQFWSKRSEIMQAIYSIETILFNEVGRIDGRDALERRDIVQVVINRSKIPYYSHLGQADNLYNYLVDSIKKNSHKYKWLNVLFKEGEFSFTYYFIPGSVRTFCPSMTRMARRLRTKNLKITMELLKKPNKDFKAIRYFSRGSMLGRINMASIWSSFLPVPERPGLQIKNSEKIKLLYKKNKYSYLYHLMDESGRVFKVIEIKNRKYVISDDEKLVFKYRNPHNFRFFEQKKN